MRLPHACFGLLVVSSFSTTSTRWEGQRFPVGVEGWRVPAEGMDQQLFQDITLTSFRMYPADEYITSTSPQDPLGSDTDGSQTHMLGSDTEGSQTQVHSCNIHYTLLKAEGVGGRGGSITYIQMWS